MAGSTWGNVWPDLRLRLVAVSSIYDASMKVKSEHDLKMKNVNLSIQMFGNESTSRALPFSRKGKPFFIDKEDDRVCIGENKNNKIELLQSLSN